MKSICEKYYWLLLGIILAFAFATRVYQLGNFKTYIFDEVYHAVTAKLILHNDVRAYEWWNQPPEPDTAVDWLHPPFAKYTQALGMKAFGENAFGWRISSVIFGTLVILVTALLADELFQDKRLSLTAALLASLDGLLLVQSRIAMNDIHVTFFLILSFWLYARYRKRVSKDLDTVIHSDKNENPLSLFENARRRTRLFTLFLCSLSIGLALASKWSGVFGLLVLLLFEFEQLAKKLRVFWRFYQDQKYLGQHTPNTSANETFSSVFSIARTPTAIKKMVITFFAQLLKIFTYFVLIPTTIYILAYTQMFIQEKSLVCERDFQVQGMCYCNDESSWWVSALKFVMPQQTAKWESFEAAGGCKRLISHFEELHRQIWWYQTNLKATHPYQSRPIEWFLDLRPVWMAVQYGNDQIANIYSQGNPLLFWFGDVAVLMTLGSFLPFFKQGGQEKDVAQEPIIQKEKVILKLEYLPTLPRLAFLFCAYVIVWLPWQLSPRIMFFYHYTPAVPTLCILLSYWLWKLYDHTPTSKEKTSTLQLGKVIFWVAVLLIAITFAIFYPNWAGISVPTWFAKSVYFFIPTWK